MVAARDSGLNPALATLLCACAGALFAWMSVPLPWMIGPITAMAAFNYLGAGLRAPRGARELGQLIIGTTLGLYFTPEIVSEVASRWPVLLLAAVLALALSAISGWVLHVITGTDRTTTFFGSVPGGATEMAILGERFGARVDRVAFAQSLRILIVVVVIPFAMTYAGVSGIDAYQPSAGMLAWNGLLVLLAVAATAGGVCSALRLPNAFMLGPLLAVIVLTATEVQFSIIPNYVSASGQLLIGCALGSRFGTGGQSALPRFVAGVVASTFVTIVLAASVGAVLGWAYGLAVPTVVLAMAPGGIAEMCITAKVLHLGVPLVTAAHVTRVLALVTMTGPIFRAAKAMSLRAPRA
jgi:membrane AbrB-like protein